MNRDNLKVIVSVIIGILLGLAIIFVLNALIFG